MEEGDPSMNGSLGPRSDPFFFSSPSPQVSIPIAHTRQMPARSYSSVNFDNRADVRPSMPRAAFSSSDFSSEQRGDAAARDYAAQHGGDLSRMIHHPMLPPLGSPGIQNEYRSFAPTNMSPDFSLHALPRADAATKSSQSPLHAQGAADANSHGRAYRSRKDRPCDSCRRRKGRCIIEEAGMDCQSCRLNGRSCTFEMSPTPRSRPIKNEDGVTILSVVVPRKRSHSHSSRKASTQSPGSHVGEHASAASNSHRIAKTGLDGSGDHNPGEGSRKLDTEIERRSKIKRPSGNQGGGSGHSKSASISQSEGPSTDTAAPLHDANEEKGNVISQGAQDSEDAASHAADAQGDQMFRSYLHAKGSTKELFSLISTMVRGQDTATQLGDAVESHPRSSHLGRRGPEEERGMMPMAIGSSSSADPMLLRQAGSPTEGLAQDTKRETDDAGGLISPALSPQVRSSDGTDSTKPAAKGAQPEAGIFAPLQVRQVANDPHHPIFFAFVPSHPYGPNRVKGHEIGAEGLAELKESLGDKIGPLMVLYSQRDSAAFPLLSESQRREFRLAAAKALEICRQANGNTVNIEVPLEPVLANATLATPTVYDQSLRPISKRAWGANLKALTEQFDISTLVTLQVALTDLTGRPSINTSGNFMSFCQTLAISHMLGLHLDCTGWNMPLEEKDVRIRLWWATVIHDKWSSLCWGRPSMIHAQDHTVPLPRRNNLSPCKEHLDDKELEHLPYGRGWTCDRADAHTPGDTFVGLCRLTVILAEILDEFHSIRQPQSLQKDAVVTAQRIKHYFVLLEDWKEVLPPTLASVLKGDEEIIAGVTSIPGTRSLQLSYLGVNLLLCRAALDSVTKRTTYDASRVGPAHRTSLQGALMMVEFLESLKDRDYKAFFLHYGSHHLASCLSLLSRLCFGFSQLGDESMLATSVATIQRLLVTLSDAHRIHNWDLAELALTRSRAILPALEARIPAFSRFFMANSRSMPPFEMASGHQDASSASLSNAEGTALMNGQSHENQVSNTGGAHSERVAASQRHVPSSGDRASRHESGVPPFSAQQNAQPFEEHRRGTLHSERASSQLFASQSHRQAVNANDASRAPFPSTEQQSGRWLGMDAAMTNPDSALDGLDNNISFDGFTGSITVDAAGVPFPLAMTMGPMDSKQLPMQNRSGGAYVVDSATSGAGHLMSGVDFDWLMTAQSYPKPSESSGQSYSHNNQSYTSFQDGGSSRGYGL